MELDNVYLNNFSSYNKYVNCYTCLIHKPKCVLIGINITISTPKILIIKSNFKNAISAITSLNPGGAVKVLTDEVPVRWSAAVCLWLSRTEVSPDWPTVTELQQMAGASEETTGWGAATLVHFYCWTNVSFIFPYFLLCIQWFIFFISLS